MKKKIFVGTLLAAIIAGGFFGLQDSGQHQAERQGVTPSSSYFDQL
ncbi:hypothetical protein [Terribacillus sp. 7520-G]|nr:hypothetical protein [Terribacillus sp. 7520-G]